MDKKEVINYLSKALDSNLNLTGLAASFTSGNLLDNVTNTLANVTSGSSVTISTGPPHLTCWDYWKNWYYPQIIRESYPVYIQQRAEDKGKQAFEIIKHLQDKKLMRLETVRDFIEAMDTLLKIL